MPVRSRWNALCLLFLLICLAIYPTSSHSQGSKPNQTLLKAQGTVGFVTAYVNGKKIGRWGKASATAPVSGSLGSIDVSSLVKPGRNTLRVVWDSPKPTCAGTVAISHASEVNRFRQLADITIGPLQKNSGERTVNFVVPNAAGVIDQTASQSRTKPRMGSGANQTRLSANISRGSFIVHVNGKKVGSYGNGYVPIDISNYVHGGENTVRITRTSKDTFGSVSIAFADLPNRFRKIADYEFTVLNKDSEKSLAFTLPDAANR